MFFLQVNYFDATIQFGIFSPAINEMMDVSLGGLGGSQISEQHIRRDDRARWWMIDEADQRVVQTFHHRRNLMPVFLLGGVWSLEPQERHTLGD